MKNTLRIAAIILALFIATQLIGLYVTGFYLSEDAKIPYGFDQKDEIKQIPNFQKQIFASFVISFAIAIVLLLVLMRIKSLWFIKAWFFTVIAIALGITLNILTVKMGLIYPSFFALMLGILLAYAKVFRRNIIVHNLTELLIYPGIAAVFVAVLSFWAAVILLLIISVYDMWAVWHSGIMQKMAKFQITTLGVFGGFFVPYASKKIREKIRLLRLKFKDHKIPDKVIKKHKIKIELAILGGGDVIFPIIATGVFLKTFGSLPAALCVTAFASLALLGLFVFGEKRKSYPAMPFLTAGVLLGMLIGWLVFIA